MSWNKAAVAATALGLCLAVSAPAPGAVVETWSLDVEVQPSSLVETLHWRVLMEDLEDVGEWSAFPVYLDEHRHLEDSEAWVISPEGDRRRLKRKEQDLREVSSDWELASSRRLLVFEPKDLVPGARLEVKARVREDFYYPGTVIHLRPLSVAFENVQVTVRRAPAVEGFRYLLRPGAPPAEGEPPGLELEETPSGLRLAGSWTKRLPPPDLAASSELSPVLYVAWNTPDTWDGVARWYRSILEGLPRADAAVTAEAKRLVADLPGGEDPEDPVFRRRKLEALVDFVRGKVRYVAVEVGIGGYRPTPAGETLDRKWGDCKDKSFLLIDLLRSVGIEAHPALIRLDGDGRIFTDFPSPFDFNHLVVAVPTDGLAVSDLDPVSEGRLFIDPTQTTGSAAYLHAEVQDQSALVVLPTEGRLVRAPVLPDSQRIGLTVELDVEPSGAASGRAELQFAGDFASDMALGMESRAPTQIEEQVRDLMLRLLPGADLSEVAWNGDTGDLPKFGAVAKVRFETLVENVEGGGSLRLDGFQWAPKPARIDELGGLPTSLPPATVENLFVLRLPENLCPPKARNDAVDLGIATFVHRVGHDGEAVRVERTTRAVGSWFAGDDLEALKSLSVAEHRATKRRLRFRCP